MTRFVAISLPAYDTWRMRKILLILALSAAALLLALALLAVPIILLYMLRLRRREVPVSSTLLARPAGAVSSGTKS